MISTELDSIVPNGVVASTKVTSGTHQEHHTQAAGLAGQSLATVGPLNDLRRKVIIIEVEGGSDKGPDGHRKDTAALVDAITRRGWICEVLFYSDSSREELFRYVVECADAFVPRVNPGKYAGYTEELFFDTCRHLHDQGIFALLHPDAMASYGAKDALYKLRNMAVGMPDTESYYSFETFAKHFPKLIAQSARVLKQNRGSTGEGIWVVKAHGWEYGATAEVGVDWLVECTEMCDNRAHIFQLGEFISFCAQYIEGGMLVDQRFLPRIVEGEIRVLMVMDTPIHVVHKKPADGQLSATLFSGAMYTYESPEKAEWRELISVWTACLPTVRELLGSYDYPLLWTADFILDTVDGRDVYRLGELNSSCVGFSTHLHLAEIVADAALNSVANKKATVA